MKKYAVIVVVFMGLGSGCNQPSVSEAKKLANDEWSQSRSELFCGMASDYLEAGQLAEAQAKAQETLLIDETNARARILLGRIYIEQGLYETAIKELTELCDSGDQSAEARYLLGVACEKVGLLREALGNFDHAFVLDPTKIEPIVAGAEVLVAMGKTSQAQRHLENRMEERPGAFREPGVCELAGRIAMKLKEHDKAVGYFQRARILDHKNKRYPEMLAAAHFAAGDFIQASEILRGIVYDRKGDAPTLVHVMLADCLLAVGKISEAKAAYQKVSQNGPESADIWASLAKVALLEDDLFLAMQAARRARRLEKDHLDAAILLGYALLRGDQHPEACKVLRGALGNHPNDPMLLGLLGRAYVETGREDEARKYYTRAIKAEPQNKIARELLVRLDNKVAVNETRAFPQ